METILAKCVIFVLILRFIPVIDRVKQITRTLRVSLFLALTGIVNSAFATTPCYLNSYLCFYDTIDQAYQACLSELPDIQAYFSDVHAPRIASSFYCRELSPNVIYYGFRLDGGTSYLDNLYGGKYYYFTSNCPAGQDRLGAPYPCVNVPSCTSSQCTEAAKNPIKNIGKPAQNMCGGNPINIGTGNKYQVEHDYSATGDFPLSFERIYNSDPSVTTAALGGNSRWRHNYERFLGSTYAGKQVAYRPDGKIYIFTFINNRWLPAGDSTLQLVQTTTPIGDWKLTLEDGTRRNL